MMAGWLSIGVGVIGLFIGLLGYFMSVLTECLLSELKIGSRDEMKSRGPKIVFITAPYLYARILCKVFKIPLHQSQIRVSYLPQFLFWSLLLLLARPTKELPEKGVSFAFDAGNLSSLLGKEALLGSFFSLLLGSISIVIGVVTLV